ncbi:MAG: hypothetical protein U0Q12_18245 [Vicinamibacterales bacterium]
MRWRYLCLLCLASWGSAVFASGWDAPKAFEFLEARQRQWAAWPSARKAGGPCISCHSGLSYLLASREVGDATPRPAERDLVAGVVQRASATPPTSTLPDPGAEAVLNLLTLSLQRRASTARVSDAERAALATLWERQIRDGADKGSWTWVDAELDPFDAAHSSYFGTALAVLALSPYPEQPADRLAETTSYLRRRIDRQPLHHKLAYLAFTRPTDRTLTDSILDATWHAQSADGGWTTASMGPWLPHEGNPPDAGSNAYTTAWAAYALHRFGIACADRRLGRALDWLERRQDRGSGGWPAVSMNKVYPRGSIQEGFMTDAATGFAAAALVACGR